jgi:hypothetical protein
MEFEGEEEARGPREPDFRRSNSNNERLHSMQVADVRFRLTLEKLIRSMLQNGAAVLSILAMLYLGSGNTCIQTIREEWNILALFLFCFALGDLAKYLLVKFQKRESVLTLLISLSFFTAQVFVTFRVYGGWSSKEGSSCLSNVFVLLLFLSCILQFIYYAILLLVVVCCVPVLLIAVCAGGVGQAAGPPSPLQNDFIQNLIRSKLTIEDFQQQTECIICCEDFTNEDDVTHLNCNSKHFFHTTCIQTWMEKGKVSCPLCNHVFTEVEMQN